MNDNEKRWHWKMDYCKSKNLSPAIPWLWEEADEAYNNLNKKKDTKMAHVNLSVQDTTREEVKEIVNKLNKKYGRKNVSYDEAVRELLKKAKGRI